MRILVIDDDRVFSEPLVWFLERKYDVVHCYCAREVLEGWAEIGWREIYAMKNDGVPGAILERLEPLMGERFASSEALEKRVREVLDERQIYEHDVGIMKHAWQCGLDPAPNCVLLDIMMAWGTYFGRLESKVGKETGLLLLRRIVERMGQVRAVVMTVHRDAEFNTRLMSEFSDVVKGILLKPITPAAVARVVDLLD